MTDLPKARLGRETTGPILPAPARLDDEAASGSDERAVFAWYLGTVGTWFGAWGVQLVLFPWLVAGVLEEGPERLGLAQMALTLPSLLLILVGGATADRYDTRRVMILVYGLAAAPSLLLAAAVRAEQLSFAVILLYAAALGTCSAFSMPARDSMLTRAAQGGIMRAVAGMTGTQFIAQMAGLAIGGAARWLGVVPILMLQAAVFLAGAAASYRLPAAPPKLQMPRETGWVRIKSGFTAVRDEPDIRAMSVMALAVGALFVGPFMVIAPIMVRDVYDGDTLDLAGVHFAFMGGIIAATVAILRRGPIERAGRATLLSLVFGAMALAAAALMLPYPALLTAIFLWGMTAGVFISTSRAVVQSRARESHRARILAVFQLGFSGGTPIGAVVWGQLIPVAGLVSSILLSSVLILAIAAIFLLTSKLWGLRATGPAA